MHSCMEPFSSKSPVWYIVSCLFCLLQVDVGHMLFWSQGIESFVSIVLSFILEIPRWPHDSKHVLLMFTHLGIHGKDCLNLKVLLFFSSNFQQNTGLVSPRVLAFYAYA